MILAWASPFKNTLTSVLREPENILPQHKSNINKHKVHLMLLLKKSIGNPTIQVYFCIFLRIKCVLEIGFTLEL